jgi:hypothetical protein
MKNFGLRMAPADDDTLSTGGKHEDSSKDSNGEALPESFAQLKYRHKISSINVLLERFKSIKSKEFETRKTMDLPPLPESLEDQKRIIEEETLYWLDLYDKSVLGEYSDEKAEKIGTSDVCIPCFVGRPIDQPLSIQYLYCIRSVDHPHTMPYDEILKGIEELDPEEKEYFEYQLRLGFLDDVVNANHYYSQWKQLTDCKPEDFYKHILEFDKEDGDDEEDYNEALRRYNKLVQLAKEGKKSYEDEEFEDCEGEDYVYESEMVANKAYRFYEAAYSELRIMRDMILKMQN